VGIRILSKFVYGPLLRATHHHRSAGRLRVVISAGFREFNEEEECERLRKLSDEELIREGKAARFLCAPNQNFGKPPRNVFVVGLRLL